MLQTQQIFKSERHNFLLKILKKLIRLLSVQLITKETFAYGAIKDLVSEKEEIREEIL